MEHNSVFWIKTNQNDTLIGNTKMRWRKPSSSVCHQIGAQFCRGFWNMNGFRSKTPRNVKFMEHNFHFFGGVSTIASSTSATGICRREIDALGPNVSAVPHDGHRGGAPNRSLVLVPHERVHNKKKNKNNADDATWRLFRFDGAIFIRPTCGPRQDDFTEFFFLSLSLSLTDSSTGVVRVGVDIFSNAGGV